MANRKGELRVKVISAKGLRDTAIFGIQDPYVQLEYGGLTVKTAVHKDGGTSPVWNESIKLSTPREAPVRLLVKVKNSSTLRDHRVGSTEVDLSDVFDRQYEQVSAPLFTRDGRQRGEVQLSITFQPAGAVQSPNGPPQASHMHPHPTPSTDVLTYTPRSTSDPCSSDDSKAVSLSTAGNQSIVEGVPLPDQADLGPLGKSLMALSMTHISPSRQQAPTHHSTNSNSSVTRLSRDVAPSAVGSLAAIPGSEASSSAAAHAAAPQGAAANAVPARRNFYPEEIVDNDPPHSWAASHQSAHSCSGDVMPHGFRLQQASDGLASDGDVGNASYSAREVYAHQYRISPDPVDYLQHKLAAQSMQQQQQQHIGKSSHCNQSFSAGQGSFHQSGQFAAMQADQGALQQPFMPNFHIMGTTPLHDGQQKQHPLQQTQGFNALDYSPHQTYGHHVRQPDAFIPVPAWRLMGTSPLHDGHHANDHAALDQHIDSGERGLTYADMAVKSWSSQARQPSVPYRNAHYNDHQSDLKVALSAPSAPSLPSFVNASPAYPLGGSHGAQHVNPFVRHSNSSSEAARHVDGRPPLPNQAGHKGQPFTGLGFGANQVSLKGTSRDRNAMV